MGRAVGLVAVIVAAFVLGGCGSLEQQEAERLLQADVADCAELAGGEIRNLMSRSSEAYATVDLLLRLDESRTRKIVASVRFVRLKDGWTVAGIDARGHGFGSLCDLGREVGNVLRREEAASADHGITTNWVTSVPAPVPVPENGPAPVNADTPKLSGLESLSTSA